MMVSEANELTSQRRFPQDFVRTPSGQKDFAGKAATKFDVSASAFAFSPSQIQFQASPTPFHVRPWLFHESGRRRTTLRPFGEYPCWKTVFTGREF